MQERGTKVREFTQKLNSDIKAVLTDEQKAEFDKKLAEMQNQRGGGQGQGQGGRGGQMGRLREAVESVGNHSVPLSRGRDPTPIPLDFLALVLSSLRDLADRVDHELRILLT